jgi:hypothetical protein
MRDWGRISRKEFLKLAGIATGVALQASSWPGKRWFAELELPDWPNLKLEQLPARLQQLLQLTPDSLIDAKGSLLLLDAGGNPSGSVPLVPTQWNQEHSHAWDKLYSDYSWGIVLHWFGDLAKFDYGLDNYLWGFNGLREVKGYLTRTSAHFLVGAAPPVSTDSAEIKPIGILQMQAADKDGTPFVASHLQSLNYEQHKNKGQYFVRALYQLSLQDPTIHSILQDFYDGRHMDPNMRTIAIEICGYDFEHAENQPDEQKIANVLSVVWAVMQRYGIRASNILGHQEIAINNADPGKKFMALMRLLVGVKALVEPDQRMKELVFGQYLSSERQPWQAVEAYFQFVRDYLVMISRPDTVYEWETYTGYWLMHDLVRGNTPGQGAAASFRKPFAEALPNPTSTFTIPNYHEGVDFFRRGPISLSTIEVQLAALGECLFVGESHGYHPGKLAIFRHRQPDGAQVLSVYGHLERLAELQAGRTYLPGEPVGSTLLSRVKDNVLHFAIAYGATWESDLHNHPNIPLNVGAEWIKQRYLNPVEYLNQHLEPHERQGWPLD